MSCSIISLLSWILTLHFFHLLVGLFLCCLFFYNCSFSISYFLNLRTSEIHLFYNLQLFYWHFLEILWLFIFLVFYNFFFWETHHRFISKKPVTKEDDGELFFISISRGLEIHERYRRSRVRGRRCWAVASYKKTHGLSVRNREKTSPASFP